MWNFNLILRDKITTLNTFQAITSCLLILTRDNRFSDGFVDETAVIQNENGIVNLIPDTKKPKYIWLAFTASLVLGTDIEGEFRVPKQTGFCDFASAGNNWEQGTVTG